MTKEDLNPEEREPGTLKEGHQKMVIALSEECVNRDWGWGPRKRHQDKGGSRGEELQKRF